MKKIFLLIFAALIVCKIELIGQGVGIGTLPLIVDEIQYGYDDAGNRTSRTYTITIIGKKSEEIETTDADETLSNAVERSLQIYPNPVKDELFVDIQKGDENENYRLMLFDGSGKMLKESYRQGNGKEPIDMRLFPNGVYFLIINTQEGKLEYKIVKK